MGHPRITGAVWALAVALVACDAPAPTSTKLGTMAELGDAERLARAVALTMSEPQQAEFVRDRLRSSPYTQHRISLHAMLTGDGGAQFLLRMARHYGSGPRELIDELGARPGLELVVPDRGQRRTWRATPNVIVAARMTETGHPRLAFHSSGRPLAYLSLRPGSTPEIDADAVLFIGPAAAFAVRADPQPDVAGDVIQDPHDGEYGGVSIKYLPNGDTVVTQLADALRDAMRANSELRRQEPQLRSPDGMLPSYTLYAGKTYLNGLHVIQGEDFGSSSDPLELRWQAKLRRRSDNKVILTQHTNMDVPNNLMTIRGLPLLDAVQSPTGYVWLKLLEDDGSWPTDHYGEYTITNEAPNYRLKSALEPYFGGGGARCGAVTPNGAFACPHITSYGAFYWAEVSFNLAWEPYSPPPVLPAVDGPGVIMPSQENTWGVTNLGGTPPYSYEWYLDGVLVGTGATFTGSISDPATLHSLLVDVTDGYGYWQQASTMISVNTGQCQPGDPNCYESLRAAPPSHRRDARPVRRPTR